MRVRKLLSCSGPKADTSCWVQAANSVDGWAHCGVQAAGVRHVLDDANELREAGPDSGLAPAAPDEGGDCRLHGGWDLQLQVTPPDGAHHLHK